jgi:hypothetical protein
MAIVGPDVPYQDSGRSISTPGGANASSCGVLAAGRMGRHAAFRISCRENRLRRARQPAPRATGAGPVAVLRDQKISGMKVWSDIGGRT